MSELTQEELDRIYKAALDLSYREGQNLRKIMLEAGLTPEEINKVIKDVFDNLVICGVRSV